MQKWANIVDAAPWDFNTCLIKDKDGRGQMLLEKYLRLSHKRRTITVRMEYDTHVNREIDVSIICPYVFEFKAHCSLLNENAVAEFTVDKMIADLKPPQFHTISSRANDTSFRLLGKTTQEDFERLMVYLTLQLGL